MFIPPKHLADNIRPSASIEGVFFDGSHLCLGADVMAQLGSDTANVFLADYAEKGYLLISPVSNGFFPKLHPTSQHLLKHKHADGAKSLALREMIIDQELCIPEGQLLHSLLGRTGILRVELDQGNE